MPRGRREQASKVKVTRLESWEFARTGAAPPVWQPAEVPGHVHLDLMRLGHIPDPFWGTNERDVAWVDQENWQYRTEFEWTPQPEHPRRALLFEGLDTMCRVFLNDEEIGSFDNMFVSHEIDVTGKLFEGCNRLHLQFAPAEEVGNLRREEYFRKHGISSTVANFDPRSFVRKAQYMFGWDWGPKLVSCGIWKPVSLLEYAERVRDVRVDQLHSNGQVVLRLQTALEGAEPASHRLFDPDDQLVQERDGDEELRITSPVLWWPHDLGRPALYRLVSKAGRHVLSQRIGLRAVELRREPDSFGESFEFAINGLPIWARGANWIPDHSFPSSVTPERIRTKLEEAKSLGMNMLRVWGGGLYESDALYEIADELGILIWQDFPFACSYYPDDGDYAGSARREAESAIVRLRNHPSLALWCGNNENLTMHEQAWGGNDRRPEGYFGERLYDDVLPAVLADQDPGRPYIPTSPWGGEADCNQGGFGDQHFWDVWHGRGDWVHYADSGARFCSEFGFASSPSESCWDLALPQEDREPRSEGVRWHDKTGKGLDTILGLVEIHYPRVETFDDFVYCTQFNQRDAMRCAIERFRRGEFCKGALIWQLNDCWPALSWSLIDFAGERKAAAEELPRLFAPQLLSLVLDGPTAHLVLINDGHEPIARTPFLRAVSLETGDVLRDRAYPVAELAVGERRVVGSLDLGGLAPTRTLLCAATEGPEVAWTLLCEPKEVEVSAAAVRAIRVHPHRVLLEPAAPLVDARLTAGNARISPRTFTLLSGSLEVSTDAHLKDLRLRSVAGFHEIDWD